ncbi:MAG: hypothetical protein PXY39_12740 [archaeon]|nr:hypothetical protein [archaeon]
MVWKQIRFKAFAAGIKSDYSLTSREGCYVRYASKSRRKSQCAEEDEGNFSVEIKTFTVVL